MSDSRVFSPRSPVSPVSPLSPTSPSCSGSIVTGDSHSVTSSVRARGIGLEIPKMWRPDVEDCIREKCLTVSARDEIVRHLVNLLFSTSTKPIRAECEELGRKLILTYPWMKDDMACGYVSFIFLFYCYYYYLFCYK